MVANALSDLDQETVLASVKEQMTKGVAPLDILAELQQGMAMVGERYASNEYFLSDLILSSEIFKSANEMLGPELVQSSDKTMGTMVLGTVAGDIHDFGKDLVKLVMSCHGIKVIDLGVDVPIDRFVEAVQQHKPELVGLSCLLTTCYESMKGTIDAIEAAGMRDNVKILIGGGPIDRAACEYAKADAFGKSAQEAVDLAKDFLGVN